MFVILIQPWGISSRSAGFAKKAFEGGDFSGEGAEFRIAISFYLINECHLPIQIASHGLLSCLYVLVRFVPDIVGFTNEMLQALGRGQAGLDPARNATPTRRRGCVDVGTGCLWPGPAPKPTARIPESP